MFKLAIVGCGDWAKIIARNIIKYNNFNLISFLCKKQKKVEKFQDIEVFNDVSEMFKKKRIDCLYIAANPKVNFDIYHLINKKQIPVIFEKPMVSKYEQAKIIEKSCSRMTYPVMVNLPILYDNNFSGGYQILKILQEKEF